RRAHRRTVRFQDPNDGPTDRIVVVQYEYRAHLGAHVPTSCVQIRAAAYPPPKDRLGPFTAVSGVRTTAATSLAHLIIASRAVKPPPVAKPRAMIIFARMQKLTSSESRELRALELRVGVALQAATAGRPAAPHELRDLLLDALARLRALDSGSEERP